MRLQANQYSTEIIIASSGPAAGHGISFDWIASFVRIENMAAVPVLYCFSTGPASTSDPKIRPGGVIEVCGIQVSGIGISSTSTTTSTGDDGHRVRITAFGG